MSRALRIQYPGAWYHVMNRGAGFRKLFVTARHRGMFLSLLGETAIPGTPCLFIRRDRIGGFATSKFVVKYDVPRFRRQAVIRG